MSNKKDRLEKGFVPPPTPRKPPPNSGKPPAPPQRPSKPTGKPTGGKK